MNPVESTAPNDCCLNAENRRSLRALREGQLFECRVCQRRFLTAEMFMDEACIEPIALRLWKFMGAAPESGWPPAGTDAVAFILDHKPYHAFNLKTEKLHAVE